MRFVPAQDVAIPASTPQWYVVVSKGELLCDIGDSWYPQSRELVEQLFSSEHIVQQHYLGLFDGSQCMVLFLSSSARESISQNLGWVQLRSQLGLIEDELFQLAGRALQVTRWFRNHRYCGICGVKTRHHGNERALVCPNCDEHYYPRISPCVIGLIRQGNKCLLARGARLPEGMFSTLAGFIEAGESAEQALEREVLEEVGIEITNIRYFGSQPWPFPGQLMLAYTAEYAAGELQPDASEIIEARWFDRENLPSIPPAGTISGTLIRDFIANV